MDIKELLPKDTEGRLRIIQETVPGRQITLAHVITSPKPIVYRKLGLNPDIDFDLGFVDRFSGTLILTGRISAVESAVKAVIHYFQNDLGYATCPVTKKQNRNHCYIIVAKKWNSNCDISIVAQLYAMKV